MAIPQFDEEHPILRDQPIADESTGFAAFSNLAGDVSKALGAQAESMVQAQSSSMLNQTMAHLDKIKSSAEINTIQNPELATEIAKKANDEYQTTVSQAVVNPADRSRLNYLGSKDQDAINLNAARATFENAKLETQAKVYNTFPTLLNGLHQSFGDEKEFNIRMNATNDMLDGALRSRGLTPVEYAGFKKQIVSLLKARQKWYGGSGQDVDANQHNTMMTNAYNRNNPSTTSNYVYGQDTQHIFNTQLDDITKAGLQNSIDNGQGIDAQAASYQTTDKAQSYWQNYAAGSASIDAEFNGGTVTFPQYKQELMQWDTLGNKSPGGIGRHNRLTKLMADLNANAYEQVIKNNKLAIQADAEFNQRAAVINSSAYSDDDKFIAERGNYNLRTQKMAGVGESMHMDNHFINPIGRKMVDTSKQSFYEGGDPNNFLVVSDYHDQSLREYLYRKMATPVQQEAARLAGNNTGLLQPDRQNIILANQDKRDYSVFQKAESSNKTTFNQKLQMGINYNVLQYISAQQSDYNRQSSLFATAQNIGMKDALDKNDLNLDNAGDHAQKAIDLINSAYPIRTGTNWMISDKDIPNVSSRDMDMIANYTINSAISRGRQGKSEERFRSALDANNLRVVSTPTGYLCVLDAHNNNVYSMKYSENYHLLTLQSHKPTSRKAESKAEIEQQKTDIAQAQVKEKFDLGFGQ